MPHWIQFQSQTGSIRRNTHAIYQAQMNLSFNPKLVRLEGISDSFEVPPGEYVSIPNWFD